jgi:hypothetical protein
VQVNVTADPTAAWVWRQVIEAAPWGHKPRRLLRDRDAVYGRDFRAVLTGSASTPSQRRWRARGRMQPGETAPDFASRDAGASAARSSVQCDHGQSSAV